MPFARFTCLAVFLFIPLSLAQTNVNPGAIQGTYFIATRPIPGATISLERFDEHGGMPGQLHPAITAGDGTFRFNDLTPGEYNIGAQVTVDQIVHSMQFHRITVAANGITPEHIGGKGRKVTGRAVPTTRSASLLPSGPLRVTVDADRDITEHWMPMPMDVIHGNDSLRKQWIDNYLQSEAGKAYLRQQHEIYATPHTFFGWSDGDGRFTLDDLPPGNYRAWLSLYRPGGSVFANAQTRFMVDAGPAASPLAIGNIAVEVDLPTIEAGNAAPLYSVSVTDSQGTPVSSAELVFEVRTPQGKSNTVAQTGADGLYHTHAVLPANTILGVAKTGYRGRDTIIGPTTRDVTIALDALPRVHGTVRDASGPVHRFDATFLADFGSGPVVVDRKFCDGGYDAILPENLQTARSWYVLIQAMGHAPQMSPALATQANGTEAVADFTLQPGQDLKGRIVNPDGTPAIDATVVVARPNWPAWLTPEREQEQTPECARTTSEGRFAIVPQSGKFALSIFSQAGYARVDNSTYQGGADIRLTPWGHVRGHELLSVKPARTHQVNASLACSNFTPQPPEACTVDQSVHANTNAEGIYELRFVPDGIWVITWSDDVQMGSGVGGGHNRLTEVVRVVAGQTTTLNFGSSGATITGTVSPAPGLDPRPGQYVVGMLTMSSPALVDPTGAPGKTHPAERAAWADAYFQTDAGLDYAKRMCSERYYGFDIAHDGSFHIENVPPGMYTLNIRSGYLRAAPQATTTVTVKSAESGKAFADVDVGTMKLINAGP